MDERWGKRLAFVPVSWCDCTSVGRSGTKDSHGKARLSPEYTDDEEEPDINGSGSGGGRTTDTALERLSLERLIAKDPRELQRLFAAGRDLGAFYLDLRRAELGEKVLSAANELFGVGADLFDLPEDAKRLYDMSRFGGHYGYGFDLKQIIKKGSGLMLITPLQLQGLLQPDPRLQGVLHRFQR